MKSTKIYNLALARKRFVSFKLQLLFHLLTLHTGPELSGKEMLLRSPQRAKQTPTAVLINTHTDRHQTGDKALLFTLTRRKSEAL